jgi:hypothetical protein
MMIQDWYPFFWGCIVALAWFVTVLIEVVYSDWYAVKKTKLLDKAHFAMSQSVKRGTA